jgi:DnaJ-class molecular chaperone
MTALKGGVEEIPVGDTTVQLRIPKGIQSGKKLRLIGKGELGVVGGQAGDLLVQVTVGGHPLYQRRGLDVDMDVDLNITEASLGTKVTLPLPLGGSVDLSIPAGVSSGTRLRVKGKGCIASDDKVGDFYAVIHIIAPSDLDEETKKLIEQLHRRLPNPREPDAKITDSSEADVACNED